MWGPASLPLSKRKSHNMGEQPSVSILPALELLLRRIEAWLRCNMFRRFTFSLEVVGITQTRSHCRYNGDILGKSIRTAPIMAACSSRPGIRSSPLRPRILGLYNTKYPDRPSKKTSPTRTSRSSIHRKLPRSFRQRDRPCQSSRLGKDLRRCLLHESRRSRLHLAIVP